MNLSVKQLREVKRGALESDAGHFRRWLCNDKGHRLKNAGVAQATKAKIDILNLKIENFCASKDLINRVKMQSTGCEKYFANHIFDKGLISR